MIQNILGTVTKRSACSSIRLSILGNIYTRVRHSPINTTIHWYRNHLSIPYSHRVYTLTV